MLSSIRACYTIFFLTFSILYHSELSLSSPHKLRIDRSFREKPQITAFKRLLDSAPKGSSLTNILVSKKRGRVLLQNIDEEDTEADSLRSRIAGLRLELGRKLREKRDLLRERDYLERANELIKGQKEAQDGVARLSKEELEEKAREIEQFRSEIPKTTALYNSLARKQEEMQQSLTKMHDDAMQLEKARGEVLAKISHLNMEDFIVAHSKGLPLSMAGALKRSAEILVPFFDTISLAADTNHRLVEHVSSEIDKYTHVNVGKSPFMSGLIFYCVALVPVLTVICFILRIFNTSVKLGVSHFVILGNLYFLGICIWCIVSALAKGIDPLLMFQKRHEKGFIVFNLFLGIYYIWHVGILSLQTLMSWKPGNLSQLVATSCVGVHYFIFTWRRVFLNSYPTMYTHSYLVYATIFTFIIYERCLRINPQMFRNSDWMLWIQGKQEIPLLDVWRSFTKHALEIVRVFTRQKKGRRRGRSEGKRSTSPTNLDIGDTQDPGNESDVEASASSRPSRRFRRIRRKRERPEEAQRRRGFLQSFFGASENGGSGDNDDSSSSDEEPATWGMFPSSGAKQSGRRKRDSSTSRKAARTFWFGW